MYFNYDSNQNIIKILADNNRGEVETLEYNYDELSQLNKAVHSQNSIHLDYNEKGAISTQTQNGIAIESVYEKGNNQLKLLGFLDQSIAYGYDEGLNLSKIISNQTQAIELKYDKNSIVTQRSYPNRNKETLTYDENYNLTQTASKKEVKYKESRVP
ncbi:MAG: Unknown protein [uncultured Sulfurovum sp.]|uniref:Rhs family protein n=1 Tax=uncultured Sulfurovum sp. TaxID=269237 RepID=A0A6S6T629_9BACT|nr:MAG: Unknown protein [uncultured Sulfurovum sp.]